MENIDSENKVLAHEMIIQNITMKKEQTRPLK